MTPLLSSELLKLRTTRAMWVAIPLVLLLAGGLPVANAALAGTGDVPELTARTLLDAVRAPVQLAGAAVLLLGLLAAAGEFRHRTVFLTRLAVPRSPRVLRAKLAAIALVGLAVGLAADALSLASGAIVLQANDVPVRLSSYGVPRVLLLAPLAVAAYGVLGVAVGALIRSTAGAVGATLVWAFVVEGILPLVTGKPHLADSLPSAALKAVLQAHARDGGPSPLLAAGLVAVYAGVLVLGAALIDRRREL
jgi:ABC-2 type transport system permease protein